MCVTDRMIEYVDHLHSHFVDPVVIRDGFYQVPQVSEYREDLVSKIMSDIIIDPHCNSIPRLCVVSQNL